MFARVASFEGGDTKRLRELNEEGLRSGTMSMPAGLKRALVLDDQERGRRLFVTFFGTRAEVEAAEERFEAMGNEFPEEIRGRRISVDVYEVVFDEQV